MTIKSKIDTTVENRESINSSEWHFHDYLFKEKKVFLFLAKNFYRITFIAIR